MFDEEFDMSNEAKRVEEEYARTQESREEGATGYSVISEVGEDDSLVRMVHEQFVDVQDRIHMLQLECARREQDLRKREERLASTPKPTPPPTTPRRPRGARTIELLNRRKTVRVENKRENEPRPPRWDAENISPVVEPTETDVARRMPTLPENTNNNLSGDIPRMPTLPSVPTRSPESMPTSVPVCTIPATEPLPSVPQVSPPSVLTVPSKIRPRDIAELKFEELNDISTEAKLTMFYNNVEGCVTDDEQRIEVATLRMDEKLRVLVHNAKREKKISDWKTLKSYLISAFSVKLSFDHIFDNTNEGKYDWTSDPHDFRNEYLYKYSNMCQAFPDKELPPFEKMLKNKLIEGFPAEYHGKLKNFTDKSVSMETFMSQIQRQRELLFSIQGSSVVTLKTSTPQFRSQPTTSHNSPQQPHNSPQYPPNPPQHPPNPPQYPPNPTPYPPNPTPYPPTPTRDPVDNGPTPQRQYRPRQQGSRPKYCKYCSQSGHSFMQCAIKPPYYVCFDCKRSDCRQGDPGCTGWVPHHYMFGPDGRPLPPPQSAPTQNLPPPPRPRQIPPNTSQHTTPRNNPPSPPETDNDRQ